MKLVQPKPQPVARKTSPGRRSADRAQDAQPTKVSITEQLLREADDFMTLKQIVEASAGQLNIKQASASLHHLQKYRAAQSMESDGHLWWYATPDTDRRGFIVEERTPEDKPRRTRRTAGAKKSPASGV